MESDRRFPTHCEFGKYCDGRGSAEPRVVVVDSASRSLAGWVLGGVAATPSALLLEKDVFLAGLNIYKIVNRYVLKMKGGVEVLDRLSPS